ncbi:MAG: acyltransferase family protein [Candidatus Bathyarchaeia archaeon]|jgi:peptidoglycan/LPS O-acetylase OafA/YrhL
MARLSLIDALRIIGITFVIIHHLQYNGGFTFFPWLYSDYIFPSPRAAFHLDIGSIGIWLFIFASGASLALKSYNFSSLKNLGAFYASRLMRIYPIYWLAVLFSIITMPISSPLTFSDYWRNFSGFQTFFITDDSWQKLNSTFWFIGLIVSLYLLFPIVYVAIKRRPKISLTAFFIIYLVSTGVAWYYFPQYAGMTDWFPLCQLFTFALGVYVIKQRLYLDFKSPSWLAAAGTLSFYLYLVHAAFLHYLPPIQFGYGFEWAMAWYFSVTIIFGCVFYAFDCFLQKKLHILWFKIKVKFGQKAIQENWQLSK